MHTCGHFEVLETLLLGNEIDGLAGGHAASKTFDTSLLEVRDGIGPVGDDGHRVRRGNECTLSINHVAVTIAIRGSTEGNVVLLDGIDKGVGISQVGVWVSSAKVRKGDAVLDG